MFGLQQLATAAGREELGPWLRFGGFVTAIFAQTCGYWVLVTAVGVLVYAESHDPFLLTVVTSLETLPMLIISPYAGVLIDRYDRRVILAIATVVEVACVAGIAMLAMAGSLSILAMLVATLVLGTIGSFDWPARGAIVPTMVKPEHIQRAVALAGTAYPAARVVGPGLAGALLSAGGAALTSWIAAAFYAALLPAIPMARPLASSELEGSTRRGPTFRDGLRYLRDEPGIQVLLGFSVVVGLFGWMPITLMPAIATDLVHTDTIGLGWLLSAGAVGSLCVNAALALGWLKVRRTMHLLGGTLFLAVAMAALSLSSSLYLSMALSLAVGAGMSGTWTAASGLMHEAVDDYYRGRMVGMQAAGISLTPVPYLALGLLARVGGTTLALIATAGIIAVLGLWLTVADSRRTRGQAVTA